MLLLLLIISIPMYFYIESELENRKFKDQIDLQNYTKLVKNRIYIFSNSNDTEFYFPRSNLYKSAIYTANSKKIFSLLSSEIDIKNIDFIDINDNRYLKTTLKPNIFNAKYLIVQKKISYYELIVNAIAILIVVAILVFLVLFSIIKQSALPYKKLNQYLEDFIKDAMHELKTPMGVILLNLDSLSVIYEQNKMIIRAKSALKNMIVIYEDLEFFVKNKKITHNKIDINLSKYLYERVEFFSDLLQSKEIKVEKDIEEEIYIKFNKLELARIIDNTISNAIKYSKTKTIIDIKVSKNQNSVSLNISDQGRGIADIKKIFKRYYREDKISGGFGLGLNIVKNICEKNSVEIFVNSKVGEGSRFEYRFNVYS